MRNRASDAAERLARSLESLVAGPARRQEMGDEAARKAASLSYECVADLYLADFAEMLAQ